MTSEISPLQHIEPRTERLPLKTFGFWLVIVLVLAGLDQLIKFIAEQNWPIFYNQNFAFSLPLPTWVMYLLYLATFLLIARYLFQHWTQSSVVQKLGFVLILSGGISNVAERLVLGSVRDYIFIANGVFNLADLFILLGVGLILSTWWATKKS